MKDATVGLREQVLGLPPTIAARSTVDQQPEPVADVRIGITYIPSIGPTPDPPDPTLRDIVRTTLTALKDATGSSPSEWCTRGPVAAVLASNLC